MPIKDKDFGKYKRPGIFTEEIDASIVELPVQDVLINLVPGFSKKGPFNTPIYVTNNSDFEAVFGEDDRRLENKGSFFHKTCKQMLKSGPIWALNLLSTNPNRDKVEWQSISVSSQYENSAVKSSAYEYFYNRQDFWERDTDAFLNVVKSNNYGVSDNQRLFHITNMSDKDITVFMIKSDVTGFDVTAEEWYGDRTKVPSYIDYREWVSDYLVTIVVVAGDWSDYKTLSNDSVFGNHFNKNGLIKGQLNNFIATRTVNVLAKYDCSLIPYFKDLNDRDMYIKNVINNNTDKTGLFCTYNEDSLLEADFKLGNLDIIGDAIAGSDTVKTINFMSYSTTLKEQETYSQKYLDSANNVITNNINSYQQDITSGVNTRSGAYTNGNIFGMTAGVIVTGVTAHTITINDGGADTYFTVGGNIITGFTTQTVTLSALTAQNASRYDVLYLTDNNVVNVINGTPADNYGGAIKPDYNYSLNDTIILGYTLQQKSGTSFAVTYFPITLSVSGYVALGSVTGYETNIYNNTDTLGEYVNIEFKGTSGQTGIYNDYNYLRQISAFNEMYDKISTQSVLIKASGATFESGDKVPVVAIVTVDATSIYNAAIKLYCDDSEQCYISGATSQFLIYYVDDEFLIHTTSVNTDSLITRNSILIDPLNPTSKTGIVAPYSKFYLDYYNGNINNLDYFYIDNNSGMSATKIYIKMYLDQNEILTVKFLSSTNPDTPYEILSTSWDDSAKYNLALTVSSNKLNWQQSVEIDNWYGDDILTCQSIKVNKSRYSEITKGSFLAAYYNEDYYYSPTGEGYLDGATPRKLTRVVKVQNDPYDVDAKILYTDAPIKIVESLDGTADYQAMSYPSIEKYVEEYKALKIKPFSVHNDSIPNGTDERQSAILDVIGYGTNLSKALADKNKISWRYLVDSFGLGLEPVDGFGSKQQLVDLCGLKLNCLGFISMPSAKIFRESTNPSFVNSEGVLSTEFIKAGADDSKNPDYYYQFGQQHGEIDGRSCVGYFFPYVRIYDNGIPKWMPPAAYAATTYMGKFTSNVAGIVPWTISAGITNGRVQNISKTEMDFTTTDQENLYQMNANPILYKVNNGYCINSESTAQVFPYSSLSFLHSREVLIELENRLYDMLLRYQWRFNTNEIRAEIKYRADKICKDMLDNDAFYDFWNVCDESNNTDHVIDLQMGVLDTYVEIVKGMGIIVNNITIMKKGGIKSIGFK